MLEWLRFRRRSRPRELPLSGAPTTPRMKTYAAESGYIYHYFFLGLQESDTDLKYGFSLSGNRKDWFRNSVLVDRAALVAWEQSHGRTLLANEKYAIAKLTLFNAFDTRNDPESIRLPIVARAMEIRQNLEKIGVE